MLASNYRKPSKPRSPTQELRGKVITHPGKITWRQDKEGNLMGYQFVHCEIVKKVRKPMRRVSNKRGRDMKIYGPRARAFIEKHCICQVWLKENGWTERENNTATKRYIGEIVTVSPIIGLSISENAPRSTEVHHTAGRIGKNYLNQSTWMAVCRENHRWIHDHPSEARAKGYLK
jgi:hypothetical protein